MKLPEDSRAAVLREFGAPLKIEAVPVPQEIEPGAILVKTDCCTICGTDVHLASGALARPVELPVIGGHEMTGSIVTFGSGLSATASVRSCGSATVSSGHVQIAAIATCAP